MEAKDLISLGAVVMSAAASYWFARRASHASHYRALVSTAYVDLCKAVASIAMAQRRGDQAAAELETAKMLLAEAKARLCAFAAPSIVTAAAQFVRDGERLGSETGQQSLVELTHAIRRADRLKAVTNEDVSQLLFGIDLKK